MMGAYAQGDIPKKVFVEDWALFEQDVRSLDSAALYGVLQQHFEITTFRISGSADPRYQTDA